MRSIRSASASSDSGGDRWIGRVDFRDERLPLIVEVQSETYHSALTDKHDDERRLSSLRAAGFEIVEVTDTQVWNHPGDVLEAVRGARRRLVGGGSAPSPAPTTTFGRGNGRSNGQFREKSA